MESLKFHRHAPAEKWRDCFIQDIHFIDKAFGRVVGDQRQAQQGIIALRLLIAGRQQLRLPGFQPC